MEIGLASKRKLGFVTGVVRRDEKDAVKGEAWDTCNNMIISWILGSIWMQLEKRFSLTNGSRKYKLNKELYEAKQQGKQVSEYYTMMKCLWEELDSLNTLPPITTVTAEITSFVEALTQQQDEHKLFQFLNGLDEVYGTQRSNILMMSPLPTVETACSFLEQEEAQRGLLSQVKEETETLAMFSKGTGGASTSTPPTTQCTGKNNYDQQKWSKGKPSGVKVAANAQNQNDNMSISSNNTTITAQQLEQLLRLLPTPSKGEDTEDEMDIHYSDHMTGNFSVLKHVVSCKDNSLINLPTGQTSKVTHTGTVILESNIKLRNVLYIPAFKHNLWSVKKLCEDLKCKATFLDEYCLIIDCVNEEIKGVGKSANGLYYLINEPVEKTLYRIKEETSSVIQRDKKRVAMNAQNYTEFPSVIRDVPKLNKETLWHHRLGHAPMKKLAMIDSIDVKGGCQNVLSHVLWQNSQSCLLKGVSQRQENC
ncbi:uncharacterized protein LOC125498304 [Beta vulgaris subsp. vulgaris]|uniref:uncharacterized protein LOC125498304 n=1 Tax=Beta vulgaris subsp. vulgaris TaxID=3555 RepID=UPI0020370AEE|nr:uncharacterized protein LOC125498304 [Beta vulgaris subsp. vulgaris]